METILQRLLLFGDGHLLRLGLLVERHLAQHFGTNRKNERETVVALHPADRDADEDAALVEHTATRHTRVAIGEGGDQTVRCVLADVPGGQDDALRVVVAETEDRIREVVGKARVDAKRRQIQIARLDNRPVAAVDLGFRVAGVDDPRRVT